MELPKISFGIYILYENICKHSTAIKTHKPLREHCFMSDFHFLIKTILAPVKMGRLHCIRFISNHIIFYHMHLVYFQGKFLYRYFTLVHMFSQQITTDLATLPQRLVAYWLHIWQTIVIFYKSLCEKSS